MANRRKLPDDETVLQLLESGKTKQQVLDLYGGGSLKYVLERHWERWLKIKGSRKKKPLRWNKKEKRKAFRVFQECDSIKETAKTMNTGTRMIRKILYEFGVPRIDEQSGNGNPSWKGGRIFDAEGYVLVKMRKHPNANSLGYVREHRLVMEEYIGRYLKRNEVVHHRNKKRADNRIENLRLFSGNGKHLKHELTGKKKKMTKEGRKRISEAVKRRWRLSRSRKA
jgi:hypothetical protein